MTESVKLRTKNIGNKMDERALYQIISSLQTDVSNLVTQLNQLRADFSGHVHGGVTAGAANTAAAATTATAVTLNTNQ